jgi:glycosyltransferase involved in cell wall biosynthesis
MASALPVVATDVGGIPGIMKQDVTGLLVGSDDEAGLRQALAALAVAPERRSALGRRGRQVAIERYAAARMVDQYLALYGRVLSAFGR